MAFFYEKLNKFAVFRHILNFQCLDWKHPIEGSRCKIGLDPG